MTIVPKVTVTTFSYSSTTIDKGKTSSTPTVSITGTAKSGPTYSSSNTSIATVNSSTGVVTGVAAGTATITISYTNYDESKSTKTYNVTIKSTVNVNTSTLYTLSNQGGINCYYGESNVTTDWNWVDARRCIKFDKKISKLTKVMGGSNLNSMYYTSSDANGFLVSADSYYVTVAYPTTEMYMKGVIHFVDGSTCVLSLYQSGGTNASLTQIIVN